MVFSPSSERNSVIRRAIFLILSLTYLSIPVPATAQARTANQTAGGEARLSAEAEARLAPIVFRGLIAAAANDRTAIEECLKQLEELAKETDEYRILCGNAELIFASAQDNRDRFIAAFVRLSQQQYSTEALNLLVRDCLQTVLVELAPLHDGWAAASLTQALEQSPAEITPMTVFLFARVREYQPADDFENLLISFLDGALERTRAAGFSSDENSWHSLVGDILPIYKLRLDADRLWILAKDYFERFGESGPQALESLTLALDVSNSRRRDPAAQWNRGLLPDRAWLRDARKRLEVSAAQKPSWRRFLSAWEEFEQGEPWLLLGPVEVTELQIDPRLSQKVTAKLDTSRVTVRQLCDALTAHSGIPIQLSEGSDDRLIASGPVTLDGPVFSGMQLILASPILKGQWHRTREGYDYQSDLRFEDQGRMIQDLETQGQSQTKKSAEQPPASPWTSRQALLIFNAIFLPLLVVAYLVRRRQTI